MPDLFYLISKWWKQLLSIILFSIVVAVVVLYLKPAKYLSTSTALPASPYDADRARIFNENIQLLYPSLGLPDDLDMIVGTGQLDTVYISVAEQFDLGSHYKVKEQGDAAIRKAAYLLKEDSRVIKSDFNELKVKVWDKDKEVAPKLANAVMQKIQSMHEDMRNESNKVVLRGLQNSSAAIQSQIDSITHFLSVALIAPPGEQAFLKRRTALSDQLVKYETLISEYKMLVDNKPPALIIAERARVTDWPDKPQRLPVLAATFVLSLLFGLLVIVLIERKATVKK